MNLSDFMKKILNWLSGPPLVMILGIALALLAALGTRLDLWKFTFGFVGLGAGTVLLSVGSLWAAGSLLLRWQRPASQRYILLVLMACSLTIVGGVTYLLVVALQSPPVIDVSTDVEHPPEYVAAADLRRPDQNSINYGGKAAAELQRRLYPDIQPIITLKVRDRVYREMRKLIEEHGWEITYEDRQNGHLEAVATSFWFGFQDDVVIRIDQHGPGSILNIRSSSRVGERDLGVNASRVRKLIAEFRAREIEIDTDLRERMLQRGG